MYNFTVHRPTPVRQAAGLLARNPDAKLLAGGHSLLPVMKQRLAQPSALIDLSLVEGLDTVDANLALGFEDDQRGYQVAADMLRDLGVRSVALMTNNPRKVQGLENGGIQVTRREPHEVEVHEHNRDYLKTKQDRLGHIGTNGDD